MSDQKTCPECGQPMLADGQQRQHEDDYRHASGCPAGTLESLQDAVEGLMRIVEGCFGQRWAVNGRRLVDTPEWCRLYSARCAANRNSTIKVRE